MLEELQRRNFSPITVRIYLRVVEEFAQYFKVSPDRLGPEHIRQYQAHLFTDRKLGAISVTQHLSALRFFFLNTLKRPWVVADMPSPKRPFRLPEVLSPEEVERLIQSAASPLHRIWLLTLYATGMRREELVQLKVDDIDSVRMVIHVRQGKGKKDRDVVLRPRLLQELRAYWRSANPKPKTHVSPARVPTRTLTSPEFLRRFLLHVLPRGFVRIRHFGFLAGRRRGVLVPRRLVNLAKMTPRPASRRASPNPSFRFNQYRNPGVHIVICMARVPGGKFRRTKVRVVTW